MYRCPDEFDDGMKIDFRTPVPCSMELVRRIYGDGAGMAPYDIVFVDPFHTYEASMMDLLGGYCLLRPGGIMVVHDCCPDDPAVVGSEFVPGSWCGVTYQAFLDFVLARDDLRYYTVDCDWGCGVVLKPETASRAENYRRFEWFAASRDEGVRFTYFTENRHALLKLRSIDEFNAALEHRPEGRWWNPYRLLAARVRSNGADQPQW